ncbi:glutamine synthetase, partial [Rhizobium ruizarguesonis]
MFDACGLTILGGMLAGLDGELDPGEETTPSHIPENTTRLTHDFLSAVETLRTSPFIADIVGASYQALYGDTKRKEALAHLRTVSDFDY